MNNVVDMQDRRDVIELNKHLDGLTVTMREELLLDAEVEQTLDNLVDDVVADVFHDEFYDALQGCAEEFRQLTESVIPDHKLDDTQDVLKCVMDQNKKLRRFIAAMEGELRKSLRCVAEDMV